MTEAVDDIDANETLTLTGVIDTVKVEAIGSVLSADAASGDGLIFVEDMAEFNEEGGGQFGLGGSVYAYSAVDADTGQITLDGVTLLAAASDGDSVSVWDAANDEAATQVVALVALPGRQASDEFTTADVAPGVADKLPLGQRDPGQGESVRMISYDDGLTWEVISVYGKKPHIQTDYVPAAAANSVEAFGYFGYSTNDYPCDGTNVPFDSVSGDTAFFALVAGTTGFFVALPEYGAYYAQFYGEVGGADPGDVYMLVLGYGSEDGGPGSGIAYGIADASGNAQFSAATAIDKTGGLAGTGVFNVSIQKVSGTGTTPVLSSGSALLLVNKLAGTY